jgi:predicted ATP-binding protein involved in virulence
MKWLQRQEWILFKERKPTRTLEMTKGAIIRCMEGAKDIGYDPKRLEMIISFENGRELPFSALSDGQRGIAALVGDLAMRAAQLNPQLEASALEETPGVVLIDEVDLYLHPKWQRSILKNLSAVFPKVQFICTTHSPQVIGEIEPERIINLGGARPEQALGLDSNSILRDVMGAGERDSKSLGLFAQVYSNIADDDLAAAKNALEEIRAMQRGSDPETVRLETVIGNLEALNGEAQS